MRNFFCALVLLFSVNLLSGQSQRLVLIEEFAQASCAACATTGPAFDSLMAVNTAKVVSIKYETSWPGADPMNAQNPADPASRAANYGVSGDPDAWADGFDFSSPANITQTRIDNEYGVPAFFNIQLTHWFNAANDSVFINCAISCSQTISMTVPKMRLALIEKTISFATAPGTNGEKIFYNVMRKMYPNANGTPLALNWTAGQTKTFSFGEKIPSYIYNKAQLAAIAWIQDDGNKSVKQTGYSATASSPSTAPPVADFTSDIISTCDGLVHFQDQSGLFPKSWLWDFGDSTGSVLQNPSHQYTAGGTYNVKLTASNANGFNQLSKPSYVTVVFSGAAPQTISAQRCGPGIVTLSASAAGGGILNWYDLNGNLVNTGLTYSPAITGSKKYVVAEQIPNPLTNSGRADSALGGGGYYTANTVHGLYFDVLDACVLESVTTYANSAGNRSIEVHDAAGTLVQSAVVPVSAGMSVVPLNFSLAKGKGYFIKLATGSTVDLYRNNAGAAYPYPGTEINVTGNDANASYYFYFYDWKVRKNPCLSQSTPVNGVDTCFVAGISEKNRSEMLSVSPNPANGDVSILFRSTVAGTYTLKVTNTLGQIVHEETWNQFAASHSAQLDLSACGKGVYLLVVSGEGKREIRKLILY